MMIHSRVKKDDGFFVFVICRRPAGFSTLCLLDSKARKLR
jgi:hypothetical protein